VELTVSYNCTVGHYLRFFCHQVDNQRVIGALQRQLPKKFHFFSVDGMNGVAPVINLVIFVQVEGC
jgi:hypothetical protein